ncbi:hypothetical protein CN204_04210 [Sinorhizobium meliloti]|uniref:hypothetical protein n=1 Tax=Rhizobium meliloti TaxID=382 RepID=UPI000FD6CD95|nr:hypothetical protein [Sinorhizobium meliloti]RVH87741.1 hypothetical protein CN204_04210 [Sinorhizobium meliloti]
MSVQGNYAGNLLQPVALNLSDTALTDVGTATGNMPTIVSSFAFANPTGGAVDCSLYWYEAATTTDYLIWMKSVATKTTELISDMPIRLRAGDKIKAIGALNVRVTLISMEMYPLSPMR